MVGRRGRRREDGLALAWLEWNCILDLDLLVVNGRKVDRQDTVEYVVEDIPEGEDTPGEDIGKRLAGRVDSQGWVCIHMGIDRLEEDKDEREDRLARCSQEEVVRIWLSRDQVVLVLDQEVDDEIDFGHACCMVLVGCMFVALSLVGSNGWFLYCNPRKTPILSVTAKHR